MRWIAVRTVHMLLVLVVGAVAGTARAHAQAVSQDRPDDAAAPTAVQDLPRGLSSERRWTVALGVGMGLLVDSAGGTVSALVERRRPGRVGVGLAVSRQNSSGAQHVLVAPVVTKELGEFARVGVGPVASMTTARPGYGYPMTPRRVSVGMMAVAIAETSASRRAYLGMTGVVGWVPNDAVSYELDYVAGEVVPFTRFVNRRVVTIGAHMGVRF